MHARSQQQQQQPSYAQAAATTRRASESTRSSGSSSSFVMVSPASSSGGAVVDRFLAFLASSPTPFHAVAHAVSRLEGAGFVRLKERDDWRDKLERGGRYFVTRNQSSIVAFAVGGAYKPGNGMSIVGCHTDSCAFKVRPISKKSKLGYLQVGVETYGGGLWQTWLDRDLGLAGRVVVRSPSSSSGTATPGYATHLVNISRPILRIPTLAVHLSRGQGEKSEYDLEKQMVPVLALEKAADELNSPPSASTSGSASTLEADAKTPAADKKSTEASDFLDPLDTSSHHHPLLLSLLSSSISSSSSNSSNGSTVSPSDIHDLELSLYDVQPPTVGGAHGEFVYGARLDNLFSSWCAVEGLVASVEAGGKADSPGVGVIALWDNEEVGSVSTQGAESNFLASILHRIPASLPTVSSGPGSRGNQSGELADDDRSLLDRTLSSSFLISCDMGHAVHPAFPEKHEENHRPMMNRGPAIKTNAKQRYASTATTTFILRRIASLAGVPLQEYEVPNTLACGSTIGPLVSQIGLRTVDIGCAQLSMHSIREQAGSRDLEYLVKLFETFFEHFHEVDIDLATGE